MADASSPRAGTGIRALAYALPERCSTLEELEAAGLLQSSAAQLHEFGFRHAWIADQPAEDLATQAVASLFETEDLDPESIDALFFAGALSRSHQTTGNGNGILGEFNYPGCKLQYHFGLSNAAVFGISQAGCLGLFNALRLASEHLAANPGSRRALCVSADVLPAGANREIIYNVISDGACAVLVERGAPRNQFIGFRQVTKGYYWNCLTHQNEIIAAYFPTAVHLIRETLRAADVAPEDLKLILPHNVSRRSWQILLSLLNLSPDLLFDRNIAEKGHVVAADNLINLKDACEEGRLLPGDRALLFTFGFGANWGCFLIEH